MRIWHLALVVFLAGVCLAVARDEVGRIALIVFVTALGEVVLGVASIMMLFQTVGAFGAARTFASHVEALVATLGVLVVGGGAMLVVLWCGAFTVTLAV